MHVLHIATGTDLTKGLECILLEHAQAVHSSEGKVADMLVIQAPRRDSPTATHFGCAASCSSSFMVLSLQSCNKNLDSLATFSTIDIRKCLHDFCAHLVQYGSQAGFSDGKHVRQYASQPLSQPEHACTADNRPLKRATLLPLSISSVKWQQPWYRQIRLLHTRVLCIAQSIYELLSGSLDKLMSRDRVQKTACAKGLALALWGCTPAVK